MNVAIILAGGIGSRLGATIPKQFIEIKGKPIIAHTLDIFEKNCHIDAIEVVCVRGYETLLRHIISKNQIRKVRWICEGGATFSLSVYNGLKNLREKASPDDLVLIHMSAAPFVDDEIVDDSIRVASRKGNAISENPCYLCMGFRNSDGTSTKSISRETISGLNTPQTFHFGDVLKLYERAEKDGILEKLEPHTTSIYYHYKRRLFFSKGSQMNIKITNKEDLALFEAVCLLRECHH